MPAKKKEDYSGMTGNDVLNSLLEENESDHLNFNETVDWKISTGSLLMDAAIKGISPSLVRLCGVSGEGKSAQALELVRQFLTSVDNSKAIWVIAEGRGLSNEHKERCGLKFVYKPSEWEVGTVFVLKTIVYDFLVKTVKKLIDNNPEKTRYCFVIDSFDGLKLKADLEEKEIWDPNQKVAGGPMLSKRFFSTLSLPLFDAGHFVVGLSQQATPIKINQYEKTPENMGMFSGGKGLEHYSDLIIEYQKAGNKDYILDNSDGYVGDGKSKVLGKRAKIVIQKTTVETSRKTSVTYPVKYGRKPSGIWVEREIGDLLIAWELAKKKGAWISFDSSLLEEVKDAGLEMPEQVNGINKLYEFLEDNQPVSKFLFNKLKGMLL